MTRDTKVPESVFHVRHALIEDISLFHDAVKMRRRCTKLPPSYWDIAYTAGEVYRRRINETLFCLGGLAGEW